MTTIIATLAIGFQASPQEIAKKDLPKEAECIVCSSGGASHGKEKPAAGVMYKGKAYFFCNAKELPMFKKDPETFMPPVLPRPAPAFDLVDSSDKTWNNETMKGKLLLIDWWATWCKPCIEMFPRIENYRERFAPQGFEVLSVSIDEKPDAYAKFVLKRKFSNPVLHDSKQTWSAWGIRSIPAMHLVKNGQIIAQWNGKIDQSVLTNAISKALQR